MNIATTPSHRLKRWLLELRRLWFFCLLLLLGGTGAGYFAGLQIPQNHSATGVILVAPLEGNPFYPSARGEQLVNLITEAQVIKSDTVVSQVIQATGLNGTPGQIRQSLSTNVPVNTQLIEITYADADKNEAVRISQAFAEAYLEFRSSQANRSLQGQVTGIQEEIDKLSSDMAEYTVLLNSDTTPAVEKTVLQAQLEAGAGQIAALGARMSSLSTTLVDPGQVVTPALADRASLLSPPFLGAVAGLFLAAFLAAGLLWLAVRRGKIRVERQLQRLELNPIHAVISTATRTAGNAKSHSFSAFRSQLLGILNQGENRVVMVLPTAKETGFPLSSIAVAEALSSAHYRTLIIDTTGSGLDPEQSMIPKEGFGEVLDGTITLTRAVDQRSEYLSVLGVGSWRHGFTAVKDKRLLTQLLAEATSRYDAVVIVAADPSDSATQWLMSGVHSVLLEVRLRTTRSSELLAAQQICSDLQAPVHGTLICPQNASHWRTHQSNYASARHDAANSEEIPEISSGKVG
ncbi:hypothetical protein [Glutamicibacter uratoxydans]|uniref:hypothetical protein n=1 Tax=Glutamicibacter uratoxydans TaxID=43667 RepID=UPI003D6F9EA6